MTKKSKASSSLFRTALHNQGGTPNRAPKADKNRSQHAGSDEYDESYEESSQASYVTSPAPSSLAATEADNEAHDIELEHDEIEIDPWELEELADDEQKEPRKRISLPLSDEDIQTARSWAQFHSPDFEAAFENSGYVGLIDRAWAHSGDNGHPFFNKRKLGGLKQWRQHGYPLLASSNVLILKCLLGEGLAPSIQQHQFLEDLYDTKSHDPLEHSEWQQRYAQFFAPSIYVREPVDRHGRNPTGNQAAQLVKALRNYVSGDDRHAKKNAEIDNQSWKGGRSNEEDIKRGMHYFLKGDIDRVGKVIAFCEALEMRLSTLSEDEMIKPLPWSLKYIGYAGSAGKRYKQYRKDLSQSWLSELVRNTLRALFEDDDFKLQFHVVFYATSLEESKIGEELISTITGAYYFTGLGLGVSPAGLSNKSADLDDEKHGDAKGQWEMTNAFRFEENAPIFVNMQAENERLEQSRDGLAAKEERKEARLRAKQAERQALKDRLKAEAASERKSEKEELVQCRKVEADWRKREKDFMDIRDTFISHSDQRKEDQKRIESRHAARRGDSESVHVEMVEFHTRARAEARRLAREAFA